MQKTWFVDQRLWDFAKMTLTRVSSHWLWLKSSHSVKTWLDSSHHLSQPDSSRVRVTKNHDSSQWLESRYHWCLLDWAELSLESLPLGTKAMYAARDNALQQEEKFKCLGVLLTSDTRWNMKIDVWICKANAALHSIYRLWWQNESFQTPKAVIFWNRLC